ncbi:hypothetical protein BO70DRAFT_399037 [Aspergillus heteromorphus CBS 117.55]|uniref:Uncharacterized protein n=1 Tax=Aspergillus heteromorphus CBS 117.55 TaxID=1448321 RepID=A0A317VJC9_9EURO|nr:uncharacterized protein BO70DRAFT_399037 [Aspergillus heteromorphus CBS 117.55]PWY72962.1 hypothetical protein BO70DRAFT_399037 [Aspergillus heteromorphus CBS 117.55]
MTWLDLSGRPGHHGIFGASYLESIPEALDEWQASRILLVMSMAVDTKTSVIKDLDARLSHFSLQKKTGVGIHGPYKDPINITHTIKNHDI